MRRKLYAGIGSRETPANVLTVMKELGARLAVRGYHLRSGGAVGADSAFEAGAHAAHGRITIFYGNRTLRAWKPFQALGSGFIPIHDQAYHEAQQVYLNHGLLTRALFSENWWSNLILRNAFQILGTRPESNPVPVDFVLYWAIPDKGTCKGGTRYAVGLAKALNIPTYNLYHSEELARAQLFLSKPLSPPNEADATPSE